MCTPSEASIEQRCLDAGSMSIGRLCSKPADGPTAFADDLLRAALCLARMLGDGNRVICFAGNAIVDGIVASNFVTQEDYGLTLDAAASERLKYQVRPQLSCLCPTRMALSRPNCDAAHHSQHARPFHHTRCGHVASELRRRLEHSPSQHLVNTSYSPAQAAKAGGARREVRCCHSLSRSRVQSEVCCATGFSKVASPVAPGAPPVGVLERDRPPRCRKSTSSHIHETGAQSPQ